MRAPMAIGRVAYSGVGPYTGDRAGRGRAIWGGWPISLVYRGVLARLAYSEGVTVTGVRGH